MVLIFTISFDYSTNYVVDLLNSKNIEVIRINKDDNTYKFKLIDSTGIYFENTITHKIINLLKVTACWWRRTGLSLSHFLNSNYPSSLIIEDLNLTKFINPNKGIILNEFLSLKEYISGKIYAECPINLGNPIFDLNRLLILEMAKKEGFKIPDFQVITNEEQLINIRNQNNKLVSKAISNGIYNNINEYKFYTYTELIEDTLYTKNINNIYFPSLINNLIEKQLEIRSFYIDGYFYSMAIFSQSNKKTSIDFRKYANNRTEPFKLPNNIEFKLKKIFNNLKLNTGSVDLIIDKYGNYIFLEINPVGQYAMTNEPCNYEIDQKIANYLIYGRT